MQEIETTRKVRALINRRTIAEAEAEAAIAEGRRTFIKEKVDQAVKEGADFNVASLLAITDSGRQSYEGRG